MHLIQSNEWVQETAQLAALSLFAYHHGMREGDRFYGGTVHQIVRFNAKMGVRLERGTRDINVGELFAYKWISDDAKSIVIAFRGTDLGLMFCIVLILR